MANVFSNLIQLTFLNLRLAHFSFRAFLAVPPLPLDMSKPSLARTARAIGGTRKNNLLITGAKFPNSNAMCEMTGISNFTIKASNYFQ